MLEVNPQQLEANTWPEKCALPIVLSFLLFVGRIGLRLAVVDQELRPGKASGEHVGG